MRRVDVEDIRRRLEDRETVLALLGLDPVRSKPDWFSACCPIHAERNASFSMARKAGRWVGFCFSCQAGGDALALIGLQRGISDFRELVAHLGRELGIGPGEARTPPRTRPVRAPEPEPDFTAARAAQHRVHEVLLDLAPLEGEPEVAGYLERRRLRLDELAAWCALPRPSGQRRLVAEIVEALGIETWKASGLADTRDPLAGFFVPEARLVIPWHGRGVGGEVHYLQRRRIDDGRPKYVAPNIKGFRPAWPFGVCDLDELAGAETALAIVEGAIDAHALLALDRMAGTDRVAIGIAGTTGWREEWAALGRGRVVFVALDDDGSGDGKVGKIARDLRAAGAREVKRLRPRANDWADVLVEERHVESSTGFHEEVGRWGRCESSVGRVDQR